MSNETQWYEASTGSDQGLVVEERTGRNVAVSYDKKDARLIAAAPEMAELLEYVDTWVQEHFDAMPVAWQTVAREIDALLAKIKGTTHA